MSAFRKKPVVVEAVQWDGTLGEARRLNDTLGLSTLGMTSHEGRNECSYWKIGTLEGGHEVSAKDWIITGVKGEHYPCKPDIFALTYEPADQPAPQGVAEVMGLVEKYASDAADFVLVGSPVSSCEPIEQAITAIITERDALRKDVKDLQHDIATYVRIAGENVHRVAELERLASRPARRYPGE